MSCIIKDIFFDVPFMGVEHGITVHIHPIHGTQLVLEHEFVIQSQHRIASLYIDIQDMK